MVNRLLLKLYKLHIAKSLMLLFIAIYFFPLLILAALNFISPTPPTLFHHYQNFTSAIIIACILAPIMETFLMQFLVYEVLAQTALKKKILCLSLISGVIFGLFHLFSAKYILVASVIGVCFQLWYILLKRRHGTIPAYLSIAGIHALRNAISVITIFGTGTT